MEDAKEPRTCQHCIHRGVCRILDGAIIEKFGKESQKLDELFKIMETLGSKCGNYIEEPIKNGG